MDSAQGDPDKTKSISTPSGARQLTENIISGVNGEMYQTAGSDDTAVKIFHRGVRSRMQKKVQLMCRNPPTDPTYEQTHTRAILWPVEVVSDADSGEFLGYAIPEANFETPMTALEYAMSELKWDTSPLPKRLTAALNLAITVHAFHHQNYVLGPFSHENILVDDGTITFTDCDVFYRVNPASSENARVQTQCPEIRTQNSATHERL